MSSDGLFDTVTTTYTLVFTAAAVAAVLWSESRAPVLEWLFKPLASLGFIVFALQAGALGSIYGQILLAGLALCLCGDVLLIAESPRAFLAGLGSFLLGHVLYVLAFLQLPTHTNALAAGLIPVGVLAILSLRWLWPQLPKGMKAAVSAYILVICSMLLAAAGTWGEPAAPWILVGAWGFAFSDLSVARNQFIHRSISNRLWGLPLYFASQLMLAWSVSYSWLRSA